MRYRSPISMTFALVLVAVLATAIPAATFDNNAKWIGVWRSELDGQPGLILTLADDAGHLSGTVVFNVVIKQNGAARVAGSLVSLVNQPRLDGDTLDFHVKRDSDGRDLEMKVKLVENNKAKLQCQNCSPANPVAELTRTP